MAPSGSKYHIGLATVVMLVLLRLNIGWHFFSEGISHYTDPGWSSEGFLRVAKGPLAPKFQSVLPTYHGFEDLLANGTREDAEPWFKKTEAHLAVYGKQFADFYPIDARQQVDAADLLAVRQKQLAAWTAIHAEDFDEYFHERDRLAKATSAASAEDVPYQKKRIADKQSELKAKANGWLGFVKEVESNYRTELANLRTPEQIKKGLPPHEKTTLETVNVVMTYGIMGIGSCLILGLLTRIACVLGAAFLLSVVLTQPFWISDAGPTFNQWVEMFALLTLATTHVGRWAGLDFFLSRLCGGCCRGKADDVSSKS